MDEDNTLIELRSRITLLKDQRSTLMTDLIAERKES